MNEILKKTVKWNAILLAAALLLFWCFRIYASWRALPLSLWHTVVPREMTAAEIDAADWRAYGEREAALFADVARRVTERLPASERVPGNRYYEGAAVFPGRFRDDWNRSYLLAPEGEPRGAVVLLHGLTDCPYSLRHVAVLYRERGFLALGVCLPGHGTVPGGLTRVRWEEWMAATRLAVREARRRVPADAPLHLVGYSNGGALAMKYALDALEAGAVSPGGRPDRLILFSPMIGITRYARYAGLTAVPALLPPFAKTAWLSILPEYNPFKYNSFPVNGARQSYRLTRALQTQIQRLSDRGGLLGLPPVLAFQSLMDHTVSTPAIFYDLYEHLPENGSALVVFDINRASELTPLMKASSRISLDQVLPPPPLSYALTVVTGAAVDGPSAAPSAANVVPPGGRTARVEGLWLPYPPDLFSLSHVALPFPVDDALYGITPPPGSSAEFGINLGALSARGERGMLVVDMDVLFRTSSNPFFPYVVERLLEGIADPAPRPVARPHIRREASPDLREREMERLLSEEPEEGESFP